MDDGLTSLPTEQEAIDLLQKMCASLAEVHKIASNSAAVLSAFPPEDCAKGIKDLDLGNQAMIIQRRFICVGRSQTHLLSRCQVVTNSRGVLSAVNGLYDPVGFAAPVTIQGRLLLRESPKKSMIGTPQHEPTIPRLDFCAAVLAIEMSDFISHEIDIKPKEVRFYCDSRVVLGYIYNKSRCFHVYVHNRIQRIRQSTRPKQWHYVPPELNPVDRASRSVPTFQPQNTSWLTGPDFLYKPSTCHLKTQASFQLVSPEIDTKIHPQPQVIFHRRERQTTWFGTF